MRKALALALLLIQLRPLAGVAICLHAAAQAEAHCGMPAQDSAPDSTSLPHSGDGGCTLMAVCAPGSPQMVQAFWQLETPVLPSPTEYGSLSQLFAGDPLAPPEPPPIA